MIAFVKNYKYFITLLGILGFLKCGTCLKQLTEKTLQIYDKRCATILPYLPRNRVNVTKLKLQLRNDAKTFHNVSLIEVEKLVRLPAFKRNRKFVIAVSGWLTELKKCEFYDDLAKAYSYRSDTNLVVLDLHIYLKVIYMMACLNTQEIGYYLAVALKKLVNIRAVPLKNIHLVGFSLGAQIVGAAGRSFKAMTGKQIPRITGLDPAKPCFQSKAIRCLSQYDAHFVDIIHTDPGAFGLSISVGHADFYVNGLAAITPGCLDIVCAHSQSFRYYIETVYPGCERNFLALRCKTYEFYKKGLCGRKGNPMGLRASEKAKGNFYMDVNPEEPFGKNADLVKFRKSRRGKTNQADLETEAFFIQLFVLPEMINSVWTVRK